MEDVDVSPKPILSKESLLSTLWSDGVLLNATVVAPSPSKDFCQLLIADDETVTIRKWKISCRKRDHLEKPKEQKRSLDEFLQDAWTHGDVKRVFGDETLRHAINIARGRVDFLPRLPRQLLVKIIGYLPLEDVVAVSHVSRRFHQLCVSDELWEHLYSVHHDSRDITQDVRAHAERVGWRRVFFANKLKLQVQLSRARSSAIKPSSSSSSAAAAVGDSKTTAAVRTRQMAPRATGRGDAAGIGKAPAAGRAAARRVTVAPGNIRTRPT